jgi:undecaprenyl-diphosphatase
VLTLMTVLTAIGFIVTELPFLDGVRAADLDANRWFAEHRTERLTAWAKRVTDAGNTWPIVAAVVVVPLLLLALRRRRDALLLPLAIGAEISTFLTVNFVVRRPRPDVEVVTSVPSTFSYPSGHIAATLVVWFGAALLCLRCGRRPLALVAAVPAAVMTVAMGWARMYLGMHHPVDVAAGLLLGVAALFAATFALRPAGARTWPSRWSVRPSASSEVLPPAAVVGDVERAGERDRLADEPTVPTAVDQLHGTDRERWRHVVHQ